MHFSPRLTLYEHLTYLRIDGEYVLRMEIPGTESSLPALAVLSIPKFWMVVACNPIEKEETWLTP